MGVGSSSGTAYSMDGAISSNIPMSTSGPYVTNQVQGEVWNQVVPQSSEYLQHIGMPYMRCAMFRRSMDICYARDYTFDSEEVKCRNEREDYKNCYFHGKEFRFMGMLHNVHKTEQGERDFVKFNLNWDRTHYDADQGDILERAENVLKIYEDKGLPGTKWMGPH